MKAFRHMVFLGVLGSVSTQAGDVEGSFETEALFVRLHSPTQRTMSREEIAQIFGLQPRKHQKDHRARKEKDFQKQRNNASLGKQKPRKGLGACMRTIAR